MVQPAKSGKRSEDSLSRRREERRSARHNSNPADWGSADAERVLALIAAVTATGGLVSFGYTRDGGTYTTTIILDGDKSVEYCRPNEDLSAFLDDLIIDFRDLG